MLECSEAERCSYQMPHVLLGLLVLPGNNKRSLCAHVVLHSQHIACGAGVRLEVRH